MGQLEDMQLFIQVVDAGGIGPAAEQVGIAKSAVSRRLTELEKRLSMTLINRTTRTSKITENGQNYYNRSIQLIKEVSELNSITSHPESVLRGTIRLSSTISFGVSHLAPALDIFSKTHPELTFDIDLSNHQVDLIEGGFDLAFRVGKLEDSSLNAKKITQIRFNICASPEYLKQYGTPETPDDLKNHRLLKLSIGDNNNWTLFDKEGQQHIVSSLPKIFSNDNDIMDNMAIQGHGIIRSATFVSWKAIAAGKLVPILQDYRLEDMSMSAIYPKTRYLSQRVSLLIDFLAERFGDNPYWDQK
ncbi:MAG: LysR family transcriptional regulator [Cocleimonas sp.]